MENFYEKTERYLLGELDGNEFAAFENALRSDAALAKSVAQHREMMQRLDAFRLRKKVESTLEAVPEKPIGRPRKPVFASILALLLLFAVAIWFFNQQPALPKAEEGPSKPQTTQPQTPVEKEIIAETQPTTPIEKPARHLALVREYHIQPSQDLVRDAAEPNPASLLKKTPGQLAAEAYSKSEYSLATQIVQDDSAVRDDETARYIRANALFQLGKFARSAKDFEALNNSFQFKHDARWNYLLCQIALGKERKAKSLLEEMVVEVDFPFHKKALELKGELNF